MDDIRKYTPYQIKQYFKAVEKKKVERLKSTIIANAVGAQDGKEINKYLKELDQGVNSE